MNKRYLLRLVCFAALIYSSNITKVSASTLIFDDGDIHTVDYTVSDGVKISNGTTLNVQDGASISSSSTYSVWHDYINDETVSTTINVEGGVINGSVHFANFNMTGGVITGGVVNFDAIGGDFNMSGGVIQGGIELWGSTSLITDGLLEGGIHSEAGGTLDISGGTFQEQIDVLENTVNIYGGTFIGGELPLLDSYLDGKFNIQGGNFTSDVGFRYSTAFDDSLVKYFSFYGNLTMSTPTFLIEDPDDPYITYETYVTGYLLDGNYISQRIVCNDDPDSTAGPCSGVQIYTTPIPSSVLLFGSGLMGLVGVPRRMNA